MRDRRITVAAILVLIVVFLNLPAPVASRVKSATSDSVHPFQNVLTVLIRKTAGSLSLLGRARSIVDENRRLEEELANLNYENELLRSYEEENRKLRKQVEFRRKQKQKLILCDVIARGGSSGWWQTITIGKGSADGIKPNKAVITTIGLVGKTTRVSEHSTDVLLAVDYNCQIACKVERNGSLGVLRGAKKSGGKGPELEMLLAAKPPQMNYIRKDQEIVVGDKVITSGLGGVFPRGLTVGEIVDVGIDESGLYQYADVQTAEDMSEVQYVFVME
jgi:rod shape-determining protein MreC